MANVVTPNPNFTKSSGSLRTRKKSMHADVPVEDRIRAAVNSGMYSLKKALGVVSSFYINLKPPCSPHCRHCDALANDV